MRSTVRLFASRSKQPTRLLNKSLFSTGSFNNLKLPLVDDLSPLWSNYFDKADAAIKEDFWGSLSTFKKAYDDQDAYAIQLENIGYSFMKGKEQPAPFYQTIKWSLDRLNELVESKQLQQSDILVPGKAFEVIKNSRKE